MRFKQIFENRKISDIITEGGNVILKTGEAAEKIDLTKADSKVFEDLKKGLLLSFEAINIKFDKQYGYPLWEDFKALVSTGKIFSGSTRSFFTKNFDTFVKYKPQVGDMDVQVPESAMKDLKEFLTDNIGTKFGDYIWKGFTHNGMQYNGLLQPPKDLQYLSDFIQLDFEGTPFEDSSPTEFATFGHYSSWEDITKNVKGLFIKYLMRALSSGIKKDKIAIVGKSGKRLKRSDLQSFYGFSVDKGFRLKIEPVLDEVGNLVLTDGLPTYKEIPSKTATYKTDLDEIFSIIFGKMPTKMEKKGLFSFVRTLDLIKNNIDKPVVEEAHDQFVRLLWGKGSQGIERNNPTADLEIKSAAYNEMLKTFPYLKAKEDNVNKMIAEYYENYKMS